VDHLLKCCTLGLLSMLFSGGEDRPPSLNIEDRQTWVLNEIAVAFGANGQPRRALSMLEMVIDIDGKSGRSSNLAISLTNIASQQFVTGSLQNAAANLRHSLEVGTSIFSNFWEGNARAVLGLLLAVFVEDGTSPNRN
jgi:hypothetical protein